MNNRLASIVFLAGAAATSPGLGAGPAEAASTVITLTPGTRPPWHSAEDRPGGRIIQSRHAD